MISLRLRMLSIAALSLFMSVPALGQSEVVCDNNRCFRVPQLRMPQLFPRRDAGFSVSASTSFHSSASTPVSYPIAPPIVSAPIYFSASPTYVSVEPLPIANPIYVPAPTPQVLPIAPAPVSKAPTPPPPSGAIYKDEVATAVDKLADRLESRMSRLEGEIAAVKRGAVGEPVSFPSRPEPPADLEKIGDVKLPRSLDPEPLPPIALPPLR